MKWNLKGTGEKKNSPWFSRGFHCYSSFLLCSLEFICIFLYLFRSFPFGVLMLGGLFCAAWLPFSSVLTEPYECFILTSCHSLLLNFFIFDSCLFSRGVFLRLSQWYIHVVQILFRLLSSQAPRAAGRGRAGQCGSGSALSCSCFDWLAYLFVGHNYSRILVFFFVLIFIIRESVGRVCKWGILPILLSIYLVTRVLPSPCVHWVHEGKTKQPENLNHKVMCCCS